VKLLLVIILLSFSLYGANGFILNEVKVICKKSISCDQRSARFQSLAGDYRSIIHLKDTLKVMASDGGYQTFTYELTKTSDKYTLTISFLLKPIINEINIGFTDRNLEDDPVRLFNLREGDYFEFQKHDDALDNLRARLESMGYPNVKLTSDVREKDDKVDINVVITLGKPRIFKTLNADTQSLFIKSFLKRKFLNLYNKPFDMNHFKIALDQAQKELFNFGYYLINLDFTPIYKKNRVILNVKVLNENIYAFDFHNLQREHRDVLHALIVDQFRKYKRPLNDQTLSTAIRQHLRNKALLNAEVRIEISTYKNKTNELINLYKIYFNEKNKTRLIKVEFNGNSFFKNSKLQRMFWKEAFELASIRYFDEQYFNFFQDFLRNKYIEKGFVQAKVFDPSVFLDSNKMAGKVEYTIQEGQRATVRNITFVGVPGELEAKVLSELSNKEGDYFNPIKMPDDIKKVAQVLQENGYYYAEVANLNDSEMVQYNKKGSDVDLFFKVDAGPIVRLNRILYLGNDTTKRKALAKKVMMEKGELITPSKTREIEGAISATGLYNSVSVIPLRHHSKNAATDLLVRVQERDYKMLEVAPGYRTDLGLKLTGTVTWQNIGGYNRTVSLRGQVNRRTSFTTIDPERRDGLKHVLEHNSSITLNESDIFDTAIDGASTFAYQTRRFYSFDANILRGNVTFTRDLTKKISSSLRYQYEDISQYNATEEINNGSFQIGSLTPSLSWDLRNNQINATKGAFFNVSAEFANPFLLSQKKPDLTINYYRLMTRNRFYIPFKNGTFAISAVAGIQENLARREVSYEGVQQTEGYIPTIKVFRLTGMDIIRGYTDAEMNRLPSRQDISSARVDNKAYMANLKLEPRYFINDLLMTGVFYDAGRVFVNKMDFGDLRDSVGVTFKVVTPVGTLDFDYGIKLLRKRDEKGRLEDPGRFHVSIGFF
jgi:outer membrane protein insertion porin family